MKVIKIGIIGVGGVAQLGHIPSFLSLPDVRISAICDPNEKKLQQVSEKFCIADTYADYHRLIERDDLDGVSICTPNNLHAEISINALRSGKNVLCEKPFALNVKETEAIIDESKKSGKLFLGNFSQRFDQCIRIIKSYIDKGRIGHIYYSRCSYLRRKGHPGLGGWFTSRKESGGGSFIDIGIHVLDLGLYLMNFPKPVSVTASTYNYFSQRAIDGGWPPAGTRMGDNFHKEIDTEDFATALIKFDNHSTLLLEAGWAGYSEKGIKISLFGERSGVELIKSAGGDDEGLPLLLRILEEFDGHLVEVNPVLPKTFSYWVDTFPGFIRHFVGCIKKEQQPVVSLDDHLTIQKIIDAVYDSAETSREVRL